MSALRLGVYGFPLFLVVLVFTVAAGARGSEPAPPGGNASEAQIRAAETLLLGPEHAAEHAAERADEARERARPSPSEQQRIAEQDRLEAEQFAEATASAAPPSEIGRWTHAPFRLPHAAVHAATLPTGEVMFWGNSFPNEPRNRGNATLWDPSKGYGSDAFTEVPPPKIDPDGAGPQRADRAPLFCAGLSMLPSGEVLVTGGNLVWPDQYTNDPYTAYAGLNRVFTFNPWARKWTEQPRMNAGRWYPGQVELADGRTLVLSGYTDQAPGGILNHDLEAFSASPELGGVGSLAGVPSAQRATGLYPHLFTLPDANVLLAGPGRSDSALLRTASFTWREYQRPSRARIGGNAVLDPGPPSGSWRVTQIGGYPNVVDAQGTHAATASTETIDGRYPGQAWKKGPSLALPRSYQNTVLLPDRSMVAVGGGIGYTAADANYAVDTNGRQRRVELYNPGANAWGLGPAQIEDRGYHSTALLLPDGRVWSAGDEKHPLEPNGGWALTDTAEIYSPPYLFKGERPRILSAPSRVHWGEVFSVVTDPRVPVDSAVLVAPGATTHGDDSTQRVVKLAVRRAYPGGIDLAAPPKRSVAPPGYYMLFILHQGVPSVASWVQLA